MNKNNRNEEQIDEILNSLDGVKRAEAPPFFYARLQNKLLPRQRSSMVVLLGYLGNPAFALASLTFFVLLNVYAITSMESTYKHADTIQTTTSPSLQTFAEEYDLSVSTLYNESKNK